MTALPGVVVLQAQGPDYSFFLMLGAIFLIFYFLVIRPQSQRQKQHEEALKKAAKGDSVVTAGGLHGKVVAVSEGVLTLEIAKGVKVTVERARIDSIQKSASRLDGQEGAEA